MVNKELIRERKAIYSNNFGAIAEAWGVHLEISIEPEDVAMLMAVMKQCRVDAITKKIADLEVGLADSLDDLNNYKFIANNYEEYLKL